MQPAIGWEVVGVGDVAVSVDAPGLPRPQTVPEPRGVVVYELGKGWGGDELFPWLPSSSQTGGRFLEGVIQK